MYHGLYTLICPMGHLGGGRRVFLVLDFLLVRGGDGLKGLFVLFSIFVTALMKIGSSAELLWPRFHKH